MIKPLLLISSLFIAVTHESRLSAQTITVNETSGTSNILELSTINKLSIDNSNLVIGLTSGTGNTYSLSGLRSIVFSGSAVTGIDNLNSTNVTISIYPNPVDDALFIQNLPEKASTLYIYRLDGTAVLCSKITASANTIDVSTLKPGLYLLKVNGQVIKFGKI